MAINTKADLDKIRAEFSKKMEPRLKEHIAPDADGNYPKDIERHIVICAGTGCISSGAMAMYDALKDEVDKAGLTDKVKLILSGCVGYCVAGPLMVVYPEGVFYQKVHPEHVAEMVESHLKNGKPVNSLMWIKPKTKDDHEPLMNNIDFFKAQKRMILHESGVIDPMVIDEYIAVDGYQAFSKAILEMTPEAIRNEVKTAGVRGRGGAGFPTGVKWEFAFQAQSDEKYVVCNADEGDPGAFMNRSVIEGNPHAVVEGMMLCGYAIGAKNGFVYIRAEYPLAIERLGKAIKEAREYGLLGKNVLGTDYEFDIDIRIGAGAFVCGEETALMRSVEGKRGEPTPRPPYPAARGLWGNPTNINNVGTLANIPWIIRNGGAEYAKIGTEKSKGTKVFALVGDVKNTGLVEVSMGSTLRTIVFDVGGGIPDRRKFKAAQLGGPSGGCIPADYLDTPIDFDSLLDLGAMMGSGGLIVMDSKTCMVDVAKFFMEFCQDESCGKCTPCRVGTKRMLEMLTRITKGEGEEGDVDKLVTLGEEIKAASLCGLGQTAANPVLSTVRYFREEYEWHITDKICPVGICADLIRFEVDTEMCKKCGVCLKACEYDAITWEKGSVAELNKDKCIQCRKCIEVCTFNAIY
jgi:NADH:ubiquinone oxidoreductase subunit F (NADH-binding)/(2Fe-2S) ferredoxin/NAD-dependent dihydropyrimidine dehydrogenase PreA subunit